MKTDYTIEDAMGIERAYCALPKGDNKADRAVRAAFCRALALAGIKFVAVDDKRCKAFRVYAADGNDFPPPPAIDKETLKELARLTEGNHHSEAAVVLAEWAKGKSVNDADGNPDPEIAEITRGLRLVREKHNRLGHLPMSLYNRRHDLLEKLMAAIEREYGKATVEAINEAM